MKKLLVLSLMAMVLCGCGSNAEPQSATKESAKDAEGNYATATVEVTDGKITAISLDEIKGGQSKKELGEEMEVWAVPRGLAAQQAGKCDVCLVGPQIRFEIKNIRKELPDIPVEMIEMRSYGTMDGKAIVKHAKSLVEK